MPKNIGHVEKELVDVFLDDEESRFRIIVDPTWTWVKTVEEAQKLLEEGRVRHLSLDHDLGACDVCMEGKTAEQWLIDHNFQSMPNCEHIGTGYTLICWMEETGLWSLRKPTLHTRNGGARTKMQLAIDRQVRLGRWT